MTTTITRDILTSKRIQPGPNQWGSLLPGLQASFLSESHEGRKRLYAAQFTYAWKYWNHELSEPSLPSFFSFLMAHVND